MHEFVVHYNLLLITLMQVFMRECVFSPLDSLLALSLTQHLRHSLHIRGSFVAVFFFFLLSCVKMSV